MAHRVRFGVQTPQQNCSWQDLVSVWKTIDDAGYDTAFAFDHFFPIFADPTGACFEGWTALTGLGVLTKKVEVGLLVTGNTYRNPALLAKMAATVDHATNGRLILGIGSGWFEQEHKAYDIPFYTTAERIRRFEEALRIIKSLWTEKKTTINGTYYKIQDAYCEPKPVRKPYPPILIGAAGEKMNLKVVAQHANIWNTFGSAEVFRKKLQVLKDHCGTVGRNFSDIEISWAGFGAVCKSESETQEALRKTAAMWGRTPEEMAPMSMVGTPDQIRTRIDEFLKVGVTHFIVSVGAPFDHAGIRRFAEEVIPKYKS